MSDPAQEWTDALDAARTTLHRRKGSLHRNAFGADCLVCRAEASATVRAYLDALDLHALARHRLEAKGSTPYDSHWRAVIEAVRP